jgi:Arc/MetJ-type ribon-helix-helix transcriptional regulator
MKPRDYNYKYLYSCIFYNVNISDQISSRLPPKFVSEIESLVNEGYYVSASDFVREAVREKLEVIKEVKLREVSLNMAKKEIYHYLLPNPDLYPYDSANELELELSRVHEALIELRKEGKAEEVE